MEDFYSYLIKTNKHCVKEIKCSDINKMKCVVIFGTRFYDLTRYMIKLARKDNNTKIILVAKEYMYQELRNDIFEYDEVIIENNNYSYDIVDKIIKTNKLSNIDGVMFYTLQKHDLGNLNILSIAHRICQNIKVYGINKDKELYEYTNLDFYLLGLKLYLKIDEYIEKSLDIILEDNK